MIEFSKQPLAWRRLVESTPKIALLWRRPSPKTEERKEMEIGELLQSRIPNSETQLIGIGHDRWVKVAIREIREDGKIRRQLLIQALGGIDDIIPAVVAAWHPNLDQEKGFETAEDWKPE